MNSTLTKLKPLTDDLSVEVVQSHIIDVLIAERAPKLMRYPRLWWTVRKLLFQAMAYRHAVSMADAIAPLTGGQVLDYLSARLRMEVNVEGVERIPTNGLAFVTPNHPAGIADGVAVWDAIRERRRDVSFIANADAIRMSPGMADTIIPVDWIEARRTPASLRETSRRTIEAVRAERLIVVFPSGRLAQPTTSGLRERPWQTTVFNLARKYRAPVVPMHIDGPNSLFYYSLWFLNEELKNMTLFRELLNKEGKSYRMIAAEPFVPTGSPAQLAPAVRHFVTREMPTGARRFNELAALRCGTP